MHAALVADLQAALAPDRVLTRPLELALYARDASVLEGRAEVVCLPLATEEVQACVRVARPHGRPFTLRGSGTCGAPSSRRGQPGQGPAHRLSRRRPPAGARGRVDLMGGR